MNIWRDRFAFLLALLFGLSPAFAVAAQDIVATPNPASAPVGVLAEFEIDQLPSPHTEVWFLRMQLEPGGSIPDGSNPGPAILYVEEGALVVSSDGSVIPGDPAATSLEELALEQGDSLLVPTGVSIAVKNTSDQPTRFLMLVMFSGMDEGQGETSGEQPVGMTSAGVAVGVAEFEPIPATMVMERVVVEPGDTMQNVSLPAEGPGPGWMGLDLGTVETGTADLMIERTSFENMIWPPMTQNQYSQPEQVVLTGAATLEQGNSYTAFGSVLTFTNTANQPLTILRVIVTPRVGE